MKKTTLILCLLLIFSLAIGQETPLEQNSIPETEVPKLVLESHSINFPQGFIKEWYVDRGLTATDDIPERYMVKFSETVGTANKFATYLPNGMLFYTSEFLLIDLIPSNIVMKTRANYNKYTIMHANFITMYDPRREIYRVKIRDQAMVKHVFYTINGIEIPMNDLPEELLVFKY